MTIVTPRRPSQRRFRPGLVQSSLGRIIVTCVSVRHSRTWLIAADKVFSMPEILIQISNGTVVRAEASPSPGDGMLPLLPVNSGYVNGRTASSHAASCPRPHRYPLQCLEPWSQLGKILSAECVGRSLQQESSSASPPKVGLSSSYGLSVPTSTRLDAASRHGPRKVID